MSPTRPHPSRLPRAGIDPITDEPTALALLAVAANPTRHETILVLLDDARCGIGLVVVSDTSDPDAVVEVVARILDPAVHDGRVAGAIVATVRPGGHEHHEHHERHEHQDLADAERWVDLDEIADRCEVELVEWFVLGAEINRPRELVNAPQRW